MNESPEEHRPDLQEPAPGSGEVSAWYVHVGDGKVLGPLGVRGLQALIDERTLTREAQIAAPGSEEWLPIFEHPVWGQLTTASRSPLRLKGSTMPPFPVIRIDPPVEAPLAEVGLTPAALARVQEVQQREIIGLARALRFQQLAGGLRGIREVLMLFVFISAGDFLTSVVGGSSEGTQSVGLMCLMVVALGYYLLKVLLTDH